ncbi:hypothetical protein BOSE62_130269 [Bosea sp. 62]|nr:hypothetical protein BOSE7B_120273 [Bosea sp. 7B]CAD5278715.1 hypothetical protein BOSE21B_30642 [Bosea sp. 21B]CAD5279830.1 hypothetical protein BOSE46_40282 [Bosea sp. 46]VVT59620.1 hypothetical protein BOS5A_210411 [Bosea sp. EC-HK365B]VXB36503.1 hypothetical protein BOSE62_130269 [Bosea sp. 62]VXB98154.1 hypothetical protein BOSE127_160304 [Bosea sp. 127]VXC31434.1 hypothetical protein BOSE29B_30609 [Bosea sp. 29B]VXC79102.1 hypothetical protein BOSE125_50281 [Bosea sp. 125]
MPASMLSHRNVMPSYDLCPVGLRSPEPGRGGVSSEMLAFVPRQWRGCATKRISPAGPQCR